MNGRLFNDTAGEITCVANNGSSVVDYMLASTSLFEYITHFQVGNEDYSDHFPISCKLLIACQKNNAANSWHDILNENKWARYKWKENKKTEFTENFSTLFSNFKNRVSNSNETALEFLCEFINIFKQAGKCLRIKGNKTAQNFASQPPWWDQDCQTAKVNKYSLLKKYRVTNNQTDYLNYKAAKSRFKKTFRSKRSQFESQKRLELLNSSRNPKEYWKQIKQNCNKSTNRSENQVNREDWLTYFKNLLNTSSLEEHEQVLQNITQNNDCIELDRQITDDEIISSLKSIHSNRSPGPDGICIEMLKVTLNETLPFLNALFNTIYDTGVFPAEWSQNIICPIHKSGSKSNPENFRGISLINSISKIFTNILTIRLQKWAENNNVIDESQAGFRKQYSTIDNIFSLQALIQKYLCRERGRFYCIFVDFRRAFDSISHNKIWDSLQRKGISENSKFLKIFQSMYSQLKSCVKINDSLTKFFECSIGTRQGCVSSPIIFSLFINDLVAYLKSETDHGIFVTNNIEDLLALMFADDVSCFSDTVIRLQRLIDLIEKFCKSVGMKLNLRKTKIMVFRNGGIVKQIERWYYEGAEIEIVSMYKYLGLYFTPKLIWSKTKELLAKQALKAASSIFRYQRQFGFFHPSDAFKLFDSMVKPVACYGAEIWGYNYSDEIERIQTKFCKYYIGLRQNTNDDFALGECGRLPLAVNYMTQAIKYWLKLLYMPNHRYPRQCYLMLKSLTDTGKITWATHIKSLLFEFGFGYAWLANEVGNCSHFLNLFKQRIKDISIQNWRRNVTESPKADHYKYFKTNLNVETYLTINLNYVCRKTLANFRCASHSLLIEKGRHVDTNKEFRFCPFCLSRNVFTVEDEFHFFMVCPIYMDLREKYFKPDWRRIVSLHKFYSIMSLVDSSSLFAVSKFLVSAFELRKIYYEV